MRRVIFWGAGISGVAAVKRQGNWLALNVLSRADLIPRCSWAQCLRLVQLCMGVTGTSILFFGSFPRASLPPRNLLLQMTEDKTQMGLKKKENVCAPVMDQLSGNV